MPLFIVSYDLMKQKDYPEIINELQRQGARRVLYSQWAIRSHLTARVMREHFQRYVDADDRVLVTEVSDWSSWNAIINLNDI